MLYTGVVEDRYDPLKLGRCKVRVVGLHTHDSTKLPTAELPWAIPMQPITSAAISGIGNTPLGVVEGTWVVVMFQEDDNQYPIIIGTLGGIPQSNSSDITIDDSTLKIKIDGELIESNTQSNVLLDSSGNAVVDSSGKPVQTAPTQPILKNTNKLKRAPEFKPSNACIALIKRFEGLRLNAYPDAATKAEPYTIGYGTTILPNGQKVQLGMTITIEQAEQYLLSDLNVKFVPAITSGIRSLITQSMFDALCCFTYNVGINALAKSTLLKELNTSKYLDAAAAFLMWTKGSAGVELPGLVARRRDEKDLFLSEGIPNIAGELPEKTQEQQAISTLAQPNSNSSQTATQSTSSIQGFRDPNGKYPLYTNEPDTNRLARHEEINKTIVYKKEAALLKGVELPGNNKWNQSPIPYNAKYPFNHVMQSESGHLLEFDDTPNSERVHIYHKSGTFTEIDANGTKVNRIVGDNFEILERDGYVAIHGSLNVTVDGAYNILIKNGLNLDVRGVANINVYNDANLNVSGSMKVSVGETFAIKAKTIKIEGDSIDIKSSASFKAFGSSVDINASGITNVNGALVNVAQGASSASGSNLSAPASKQSPEMPNISKLIVIPRGSSTPMYETPEDGDPTAYIQKQINNGAIKQEEIDSGTVQETKIPIVNSVISAVKSCDIIMMKETFEPAFVLSNHYTLGNMTQNGSRPIISQQGNSIQQIVCNLQGLCGNCLEPIYDLYPNLIITSAFRRPKDDNNSSSKSQHYSGQAVDIVLKGDRQYHYEAIQKIQSIVPYDQLILEYLGGITVWIHISFSYNKARKMIFTMRDHKVISSIGQFILVT